MVPEWFDDMVKSVAVVEAVLVVVAALEDAELSLKPFCASESWSVAVGYSVFSLQKEIFLLSKRTGLLLVL
jgi:hypothetical protein